MTWAAGALWRRACPATSGRTRSPCLTCWRCAGLGHLVQVGCKHLDQLGGKLTTGSAAPSLPLPLRIHAALLDARPACHAHLPTQNGTLDAVVMKRPTVEHFTFPSCLLTTVPDVEFDVVGGGWREERRGTHAGAAVTQLRIDSSAAAALVAAGVLPATAVTSPMLLALRCRAACCPTHPPCPPLQRDQGFAFPAGFSNWDAWGRINEVLTMLKGSGA